MRQLYFLRIAAIVCLVFWQVGCSHAPLKPLSWQQQQKNLSALQSWQAHGVLSIADSTERHMVSFEWSQGDRNSFNVRLSVLGMFRPTVVYQKGAVFGLQAGGKTLRATSAQQLMHEELGWSVPLTACAYWLRGMSAPTSHTQAVTQYRDRYGRLVRLTQQGWSVYYLRYAAYQQYELPTEIMALGDGMQLHIVITHWSLTPPRTAAVDSDMRLLRSL